MKNSIITGIIALSLAVTSCVDVPEIAPANSDRDLHNNPVETPDFNPNTPSNMIVTNVNASFVFDYENEFDMNLDIDQDGQHDFVIYGYSLQDGNAGFLHTVAMYATGNNKLAYNEPVNVECTQSIVINPIRTYNNNQEVSNGAHWDNMGVMYIMSDYQDCNSYLNFTHNGRSNFYGVKLEINGLTHYGWVELKLSPPNRSGFTNCSSRWTVKRFAYNETPDETVRIPM